MKPTDKPEGEFARYAPAPRQLQAVHLAERRKGAEGVAEHRGGRRRSAEAPPAVHVEAKPSVIIMMRQARTFTAVRREHPSVPAPTIRLRTYLCACVRRATSCAVVVVRL